MFIRYQDRFRNRAAELLFAIENRLDRIMQGWLLLAGLACAARIAWNPLRGPVDPLTIGPYLLLILAPFASMVVAMRWFVDADRMPQPSFRLARIGRWLPTDLESARKHSLYGAGGIMVSLLIGMLLNVPIRALEYLAALPALAGPIPSWLADLSLLMTLDVVIFTSLYTIAFIAALRRVPLFPRLLVAIWFCDLTMQVVISKIVAHAPGLPSDVGAALNTLLEGNMQKVLISAGVWLPYLLFSKRVNVTYRHRLRR